VRSVDCHHLVRDQARAVRDGSVTAESLVRGTREAIDREESRLRAWVALAGDLDEQLHAVSNSDTPGPLSGISIGVKDLVDVRGLPTRAGTTITTDAVKRRDASIVRRLRDLGAVIQGKTVTTEFGYFAPGPTRNPHADDHTPGGSSSGSAAAVGAGTVPIAIGTQTAGSLTRPASFCGAAGLVLSTGTVDLEGVAGLSESLDTLGILARTVDDLSYVHDAMTGRAGGTSNPVTSISVWFGSSLGPVEPEMNALLRRIPDLVGRLGLTASELEWDDHVRTLADDHATVMAHEAARTLRDVHDRAGDALSAPLRTLVADGRRVSETTRDDAVVRSARSRALLGDILGEHSVIVGPAALGPAPEGLGATGSPVLSRPWQLLGLPVVVVPGARTAAGLPLGIQLIGPVGGESVLLDIGARLEPLLRALPPVTPDPA